MFYRAGSVPETGKQIKPFVELWRLQLKELYKTFRGKHRAKQETRKALRGAVIQKKDCLCILLTDFRKALIFLNIFIVSPPENS